MTGPAAAERRLLGAVLVAACLFPAAYVLPAGLGLPTLVFHPLARTVRFTAAPADLEMRYYGDLLFASLVSLSGSLLQYRWGAPPVQPQLLCWTALTLVVFDGALYVLRVFAAL